MPRPRHTAYTLCLSTLSKNPRATYGELCVRARRLRLTVYPINYGRALKALGLVGPRGRKARGLRAEA